VVDAVSGAIYVLGGFSGGSTPYKDVWASNNGGAWPDYVKGVVGGTLGGHSGVLTGTKGDLWGTRGYERG
jgi:hypothetical protein